MSNKALSKRWIAFLTFAFIAGLLLRVLYVNDMEYKEDEEYNFTQSQKIGVSEPWPWYGIASGVYLVNPGASVWVFAGLAKISRAKTPTELARALQIFSLLGISLIIPFAVGFVHPREREPWLWAFALAMVNPFAILYQRKLWPEPFLPFFSMLVFMGWWKRDKKWGAFVWGLIGAFIGQIHMSGFFFAAGLFLWSVFANQRLPVKKKIQWPSWFIGSCLGAWPLLPWAYYIITHPVHDPVSAGMNEILQFKYWAFWVTDPTGLHLGNPLGLLRGESNWAQISDFVRYPLISGHATYAVGFTHVLVLGAMLTLLGTGVQTLIRSRKNWKADLVGEDSETHFVQNAALWGQGILITITGIVIRRYYMMVTFPLEFIWLVRMGMKGMSQRAWRFVLVLLFAGECFISAHFVGYVHVNNGSTQGDYGDAYHVIVERSQHSKK